MLNTLSDFMDETLVRAGQTTTAATNGLYTDAILKDWANMAYRFAAARHKWPFTEGRVSTTLTSSEEYEYPEGWRTDSIRFLTVGGKRFQKLTFEDYQRYKETQPSGTDRVFTDYGNLFFINLNSDASGTITTYGQYLPAGFVDLTDLTTSTVFSGREEDGNEAIVEEMLSYAKKREKKFDESLAHHNRAIEVLDGLWKRITDEQFGYQTKNRGMFEHFDVLEGSKFDDSLHRDRWY